MPSLGTAYYLTKLARTSPNPACKRCGDFGYFERGFFGIVTRCDCGAASKADAQPAPQSPPQGGSN